MMGPSPSVRTLAAASLFALACFSITRKTKAWSLWGEEESKKEESLLEGLPLDEIERGVSTVWKVANAGPNEALKTAFGASLLLYGRHFSYLCLQLQAFRVTGWPQTRDGIAELGRAYVRTRDVIREEYPNLREAQELLVEVQQRVSSLSADVEAAKKAGQGGGVDYELLEKAQAELQAALSDKKRLEAALSSVSAVAEAIDVAQVQKVMHGIYAGAIQLFAVANSRTLGTVALGANIGEMLSQSLDWVQPQVEGVVESQTEGLPAEYKKWSRALARGGCTLAGVLAAHYADRLTLTVSAAMLGSTIVTDAAAETVARRTPKGSRARRLARDKKKRTAVMYVLTGLGLAMQLRPWDSINPVARALIYVPSKLDVLLRALSLGGKASRAASEM